MDGRLEHTETMLRNASAPASPQTLLKAKLKLK